MILFALTVASACSSPQPSDIDPTLKVKTETTEKINQVQAVNIELEEIDGELDSLILKLK